MGGVRGRYFFSVKIKFKENRVCFRGGVRGMVYLTKAFDMT